MTEVWTLEQYAAYQAGQHVPRFLTMDASAPEEDLEERLRQLCEATGHYRYHTRKSTGSTPGWPDDAIVHPEGDIGGGSTLFLWELKTATGQVSPAQRRWLEALEKVTRVEVGVYRPCDWEIILEKLRRA